MKKMETAVRNGIVRSLGPIGIFTLASFPLLLPLCAVFMTAAIGEEYGELEKMEYCAEHGIPYVRVYNYGD